MLKLRRAIVVDAGSAPDGTAAREQRLAVELERGSRRAPPGDRRRRRSSGARELGDEVIVNTEALDLGLGSGGFDVVHVNLTRGLVGAGRERRARDEAQLHEPAARGRSRSRGRRSACRSSAPSACSRCTVSCAAVAWAFAAAAPGAKLGYVQTAGGALPGGHSRAVRELRERGLLAGHLTAGAAFGGEGEAITTAGALHHGLRVLGWDAAVVRPRPGDRRLGLGARARRHGGARLGARGARARMRRR